MSDFELRVSLHFKLLVEKEMNRLIGSTPSTPSVTTENSESTSKSFDSQLSAEFVFQVCFRLKSLPSLICPLGSMQIGFQILQAEP